MTSEDNNEYTFVDEKGIPVIDSRKNAESGVID